MARGTVPTVPDDGKTTRQRRTSPLVVDELTSRREVADVRTAVVYEHVHNPVVTPVG